MAWGAVVGAGISAIGSLLSNQMQNNSNSNLNKENRQFQWAQMLKQQQWSEQMWQKENEYNTPLAQRQRLQEAGYNPWISGSGGMSNVAQAPTTPGYASAPASAPMHYDNPFGNLASTVNDTLRAKAESANQLSQAAQNAVGTAVALYEKTGDLDAAQRFLSTSLKAVGGANFSKDSLYFQQFELAVRGKELENINKDLNNQYQMVQNDIQLKTGLPLAEANLDNIRRSTDFLGKQIEEAVSRIDLNKENILNAKETRKMIEAQTRSALSEVVANYANAYRLKKEGDKFVADTDTVNQVREHIVKSAKYSATKALNEAAISYDVATESRSRRVQREKARTWMMSDAGKENALGNQKLNDDKYRNAVGSSVQVIDDLLPDFFIPMGK